MSGRLHRAHDRRVAGAGYGNDGDGDADEMMVVSRQTQRSDRGGAITTSLTYSSSNHSMTSSQADPFGLETSKKPPPSPVQQGPIGGATATTATATTTVLNSTPRSTTESSTTTLSNKK
jgi:hypothetical protein